MSHRDSDCNIAARQGNLAELRSLERLATMHAAPRKQIFGSDNSVRLQIYCYGICRRSRAITFTGLL